MYLKSIKALGFKSFADKVDLNITEGITAIVGPNGSGKSNVLDAVKWVLGEQSIKSLRGKNGMTDVIFSGSESRKEAKNASVTLTFDNSDNYLNSPFAELEIKRVVYKNGENEYFINNTRVRLKDITELFMDSGAGKESFNIISQGAVADIISSKPQERRTIFEEAAGVLKYKKRKELSVKKLDNTRDNLEKVSLVIDELETNVEPLRIQSEQANKYMEFSEELKSIEIALVSLDISNTLNMVNKVREELEELSKETLKLEIASNEDNSKIELQKLNLLKIDEDFINKNELMNKLRVSLNDLEIEKQLINERKKFDVDVDLVNERILKIKEEVLVIDNKLKIIEKDRSLNADKVSELEGKLENSMSEYNVLCDEESSLKGELDSLYKKILETKNSISILKDNIESSRRIPYAIKNVLNNPRLKGIYNTIGNIVEVDSMYVKAIDIALGGSANIVVVENEKAAKEAVVYLKDNKLGRASFFPLNIIKEKYIDSEILDKCASVRGFIGVASDLVKTKEIFNKVIKNQLGNILVVDTIDVMNQLGKLINYKYRVVTVDGDILHTGGLITGGYINANSNLLDKEKLNDFYKVLELDEISYTKLERNIELINSNKEDVNTLIHEINLELVNSKEMVNIKNNEFEELNKKKIEFERDLSNDENTKDNSLVLKEEQLLIKFYEVTNELELLEKEVNLVKEQKSSLNDLIVSLEHDKKLKNSEFYQHQQLIKEKEITLTKNDVLLDNYLNHLANEYELTYEAARDNYSLDMEVENARYKVNYLKKEIKALGIVNLGAPLEYERVRERYDFLKNQKTDLEKSLIELTDLISEMDEIMITKFSETFKILSEEFQKVFKLLFKGGRGILKLTDPEDLLNTGIEIVAEPPGKKLNSIDLLSGGEKTLTAIALLFSILNIKTVPFCILDEVEAALDEANVEAFGKYLESKKEKSQFIIITHKKKTMEFADVLYGITMQESGVSKLVSVKLEN